MWVLRRLEENNLVNCIPLKEIFTIGRTECSLTITDDKSVSRKHAAITFPNQSTSTPLLSDGGSKFGTFINGDRLNGNSTLKSGDRIKFGGATSEFILESKDFSVFVKTKRLEYVSSLKELGNKFGFDVRVKGVKETAYFVLDDDFEDVDAELVEALLLAKYIVSPSYFSQLNCDNCFSLALIQPTITSRPFPMDCWIPQKSRLTTFKAIFEGIKRFVLMNQDNEQVKVIAGLLGIDVKIVVDLSNLTFNEVFIRNTDFSVSELIENPVRVLEYESIVDALLRNEGQLIEIQTIYPILKPAVSRTETVDAGNIKPVGIDDPISPAFDESSKPYVSVKSKSSTASTILPSESVEQVYTGRSLTAVLPIPSNLLRLPQRDPSMSTVSVSSKKIFVKCHPKNRQPGTIPALIGPDQLEPTTRRPTASAVITSQSPQQSIKRRMLVKDSWLAEDDFSEKEIRQGQSVKENKGLFNVASTRQQPNKQVVLNPVISAEINNNIPATSIITSSTEPAPSPLASSASAPLPPSSKFQSAFFKNISINKRG